MTRPNLATAKPLFLAQEAPVCAVSEALTSGRYNAACVVMPTGSGKTIVMRAIVAELLRTGRIAVACLVAPQDRLVDALAEHDVFRSVVAGDSTDPVQRQGQVIWPPLHAPIRSRRDIGGTSPLDHLLLPRVEGSQLDDARLWTGELLGPVFVISRQLLCSERGEAALAAQPKATLKRLGLICDEFQHHRKNDRNIAGRLVDWAMAQGCLVLGATATPFDEHGSVIRPSMFVHSTSVVQWALDPHSMVPTIWKVRRLFVGTVKDGDAIYEDQIGRMQTRGRSKGKAQTAKRTTSAAVLKSYAVAIAQDWLALGKPKAIANGPTREWNAALEAAFRAVDPTVRIASVIGDTVSPEVEAGLSRDANRKLTDLWDKVTYDVVISCCRFNEGRDWPPCSMFYNIGFPSSMALILQRFGRASRSKAYIKDYAQRSPIPASEQHMVFVTPEVLGDKARDKAWQNLRHCAGLAATYLCDYQEGLRWAAPDGPRTAGWAQSKRGQRMGLEAAGQSEPEVMKARAKLNAWLEGRRENPPTGKQIVRWLDTAAATLTADQRREVAANAVMQNPKLRAFAEREAAKASRAARAKRDPGAHGWVQADLRAVFDAVLDAGADELVMPPRDWVELAAEFTAESATGLAARLSTQALSFGAWTLPLYEREARAFLTTFGRWPTSYDGPWPAFNGVTWEAAFAALRRKLGCNAADLHARWDADAVAHWRTTHGKLPRGHKALERSVEEARLNQALATLRRNVRHEDLLVEFSLERTTRDALLQEIVDWVAQNGCEPRGTENAPLEERRLGERLSNMRRTHPDDVVRMGLPANGDRGAAVARSSTPDRRAKLADHMRKTRGFHQYTTFGEIVSEAARAWALEYEPSDIVRSGSHCGRVRRLPAGRFAAIQHSNRGLADCSDRCQASTWSRTCDEIEADCWLFDVNGARVSWSVLRGAGLVPSPGTAAERTHYLDWAKPDRDGKPVKRVWTPPAEVKAAA